VPDDLVFPADASTRTFTLEGDVISIGRRSHRDGTLPDIDLGEPPEDPGVSREHARLVRIHDDRYSLVDCGSANGTYLNEDRVRLPVDAPVPLADGDRIRLGAWTSIVIAYRTATGSDTS
jgi:pSer/pThr/pTyr-binding forkhead associated (FHA) protein